MRRSIKEWAVAILACVLVAFAVAVFALAKIGMYGGDIDCLFVRCVKVIQ